MAGFLVMMVGCSSNATTRTAERAEDVPAVMSFDEYQQVEHDEPYVYELRRPNQEGALLYFGSRHTFDPGDEQLDHLSRLWESFRPTLALTEGGDFEPGDLSRAEVVQRYGEAGMVRWLAERDEIPARSLDPEREAEIDHLLREGWSETELIVFYALRQVVQSNQQGREVPYAEVLPRYLSSLDERFGLKGPTSTAEFDDAVADLLPGLDDWTRTPASYLYPGPQEPEYFTNRLSTASNLLRDNYHVRLIADSVAAGHRVFVVAGSAHAVMQEPAMRGLLSVE